MKTLGVMANWTLIFILHSPHVCSSPGVLTTIELTVPGPPQQSPPHLSVVPVSCTSLLSYLKSIFKVPLFLPLLRSGYYQHRVFRGFPISPLLIKASPCGQNDLSNMKIPFVRLILLLKVFTDSSLKQRQVQTQSWHKELLSIWPHLLFQYLSHQSTHHNFSHRNKLHCYFLSILYWILLSAWNILPAGTWPYILTNFILLEVLSLFSPFPLNWFKCSPLTFLSLNFLEICKS